MGHYLVVLVHSEILHRPTGREYDYDIEPKTDQDATILSFNLQDHTVQEAEVDISAFRYQQGYYAYCDFIRQRDYYSFLKYGENQIIKYGGEYEYFGGAGSMICITVESFERILLSFLKGNL